MSDKADSIIHPLAELADKVAKDTEALSTEVHKLRTEVHKLRTPDGSSPVIISDGSLIISSIGDQISSGARQADGTYTYQVTKTAFVALRHCSGAPRKAPGTGWPNWSLTIPLTNPAGSIVLKPLGASIMQIAGVPQNITPSVDTPSGENVLKTSFTANFDAAVFDPGDGSGTTTHFKPHLSLHFSSND